MRDMERIKPKYNVTLDNKQIVMIIVSSLVILVLVFVIGFMLGKNTGIKEVQQTPASQGQNKPQNAVVFTQQTVGTPGEVAGEVTGEASGQAAGQNSGTTSEQANVQAPATQTTVVLTPTTTASKHTELTFYKSLTQEGQQKKEIHKKQAKKQASKKAERGTAGKFSIQCGAFKEKGGAEKLSSELKNKYRLSAWIVPVSAKGEMLYGVRVGHFESREKAQTYEKKQLVPKGLRNCVITVAK